MALVALFCYSQAIFSGLLLVAYPSTLHHNLKGAKFPFVSWLIFWLMLSNLGSLGVAYGTLENYGKGHTIDNTPISILWLLMISFAV